jgi:O-antigen/teichoic acid export membrane protein
MSNATSKSTFFRQSAWMVIATVGGGVFMSAVHTVASKMEKEEYGVFFALLRSLLLVGIPAGGLQTILAQQTAGAITDAQLRQLSATVRWVFRWVFIAWLACGVVLIFVQSHILATLKIHNPAALWITAVVALTSLWIPAVKGVLQGQQNFLALGWVAILDGVGRFAAIAVIVLLLAGQAAGALTGALIGQVLSLALGVWWARDVFRGPGEPFDRGDWTRRVLPLTLAPAGILVLQTADVIFVQSIFPADQSPFYMPPAMIGFALVQFTVPLAAVMFPKIVRSAARSETSDAFKLTLATTALLGAIAAIAATLLPELPLRILYFKSPVYWKCAPLVPWFAWCMLLLTIGNALVTYLLAHGRSAIAVWLVMLSLGYLAVLFTLKDRLVAMEMFAAFKLVVQTMTAFNLALVAISLALTRKIPAPSRANS